MPLQVQDSEKTKYNCCTNGYENGYYAKMRLKQLAFHWCIMSFIIRPFITVDSFHYILILREFTESTFSFNIYQTLFTDRIVFINYLWSWS